MNVFKFRFFAFWVLLSFSVLQYASAQQFIFFRFANGTQSAYPLQQVQKLNFEGQNVKLQLNDGTSYSWAMATIDHYKYMDMTTDKLHLLGSGNPWEVKVIPNPSEGRQLLRYRLPTSGQVRIRVMDLSGRKLLEDQIQGKAGEQEYQLDFPGAKPGSYLLMLETQSFSVSQKIIRR